MPGNERPILAIEMSQRRGSIALGLSTERCAYRELPGGGGDQHNDPLLSTIDALTRGCGHRPEDLAAIAVSIGPGGFTGLRVATTAAKCIAAMLAIPVVAVPSAVVIAASRGEGPRLVALAAKKGSCWMTRIEGSGPEIRIEGEPGLVDGDSFEVRDAVLLFADDHAPESILSKARAAGVVLAPLDPRADVLLGVARDRLARGDTIDPLRLSPLYPREPEAVTLWRTRHGG